MASTYELYLGGPRQQNIDWAIFPSAPFSASNPAVQPPANKTPVIFGASRTLDFADDGALSYFYNTTLAAVPGFVTNDKVSAIAIPSQSLFLGCFYSVNNPVTGGVFSLIIRAAAQTIATGISTTSVTSGWLPYTGNGVVVPSTTSVVLLQAQMFHYFATPDIIDVQFTTVPAGNLGALSITVTPVYLNFQPFGQS
jgi:hypothetical protein